MRTYTSNRARQAAGGYAHALYASFCEWRARMCAYALTSTSAGCSLDSCSYVHPAFRVQGSGFHLVLSHIRIPHSQSSSNLVLTMSLPPSVPPCVSPFLSLPPPLPLSSFPPYSPLSFQPPSPPPSPRPFPAPRHHFPSLRGWKVGDVAPREPVAQGDVIGLTVTRKERVEDGSGGGAVVDVELLKNGEKMGVCVSGLHLCASRHWFFAVSGESEAVTLSRLVL